MSSQENKQKVWDFIKSIEVGMLTTLDGEDLRARPMHLVQKEYDGTIWFYTRRSSAKAFETRENQNICLTFEDHDAETYVSLSGLARLSDRRDLIEEFWSPFVGAWFPEGKDDPDVVLLEIQIHKGEYWDSTSSRMVQMFEMLKANLFKEEANLGENKKFG